MKKKIGLISLDSSTAKWIYEKLRISSQGGMAAQDFQEGLEDLLNGAVDSLMLELDETETPFYSQTIYSSAAHSPLIQDFGKSSGKGRKSRLPRKNLIFSGFWPATGEKYLQKSRFTRQCGKENICWMTATSWRS